MLKKSKYIWKYEVRLKVEVNEIIKKETKVRGRVKFR